MDRLTLNDSTMIMIMKMSEGNPGAVVCLTDMLKKTDWYDDVPGVMMILNLDGMGVYGSKLYMLWSDCCNKDLTQLELVLRNWQMGQLYLDDIHANLNSGRGTPFTDLKSLEELFDK